MPRHTPRLHTGTKQQAALTAGRVFVQAMAEAVSGLGLREDGLTEQCLEHEAASGVWKPRALAASSVCAVAAAWLYAPH